MNSLIIKKMGVINVTPNSFSGLGELLSPEEILNRIRSFGPVDILDVGAESTAPMNQAITSHEELLRLVSVFPLLKNLTVPLSLDTYHSETIMSFAQIWLDHGMNTPLIWNDVSGKWDEHVSDFLSLNQNFSYVFCHNLAPTRELSGKHMEVEFSPRAGEEYLEELASYFKPYVRKRVILDPTLGFSKTYEQNWYVLENFGKLQKMVGHSDWLLGYSRKSVLRKRFGIEKLTNENREELDQYHGKILEKIKPQLRGTVYIRTHRPELI